MVVSGGHGEETQWLWQQTLNVVAALLITCTSNKEVRVADASGGWVVDASGG